MNVIRIDAQALTALIAAGGDDFRLELQRAVVSEVTRQTLLKDAFKVAEEVIPEAIFELVERIRGDVALQAEFARLIAEKCQYDYNSPGGWKAKPEQKEALKRAVNEVHGEAIRAAGLSVTIQRDEILKELRAWIDEKLPANVETAVQAYSDREVERRVRERLATIAQGIAG